MKLFSGALDNSEDIIRIEKHSAKVLHSAVKSLIHAIHTEDN